jgi:hypothetical protein
MKATDHPLASLLARREDQEGLLADIVAAEAKTMMLATPSRRCPQSDPGAHEEEITSERGSTIQTLNEDYEAQRVKTLRRANCSDVDESIFTGIMVRVMHIWVFGVALERQACLR